MSGYQPKQVIKTSQGRLLECLWSRDGNNVTQNAKAIGLNRDRVFMWRSRGEIPLQAVGPVARRLKVPIHALNYEESVRITGEGLPWEKIVKKCRLSPREVAYVLEGVFPKTVKEVLNEDSKV